MKIHFLLFVSPVTLAIWQKMNFQDLTPALHICQHPGSGLLREFGGEEVAGLLHPGGKDCAQLPACVEVLGVLGYVLQLVGIGSQVEELVDAVVMVVDILVRGSDDRAPLPAAADVAVEGREDIRAAVRARVGKQREQARALCEAQGGRPASSMSVGATSTLLQM